MSKIFFLGCLIFSVYNVLYFKKLPHRPKIHSHNSSIKEIYLNLIYPPYFLPHGLLHTIYQLYRRINIIKESRRYDVVLQMEDEAKILIEIFEPFSIGSSGKMRAHVARRMLAMILYMTVGIFRILLDVTIKVSKSRSDILLFIPRVLKRRKRLRRSEEEKGEKKCVANDKVKSNGRKWLLFKKKEEGGIHFERRYWVDAQESQSSDSVQFESNVLLVHGLNGSSSSSYIKGMANVFLRKNCRVFCFNARGSKLPPTTNVFSHIGLTSDIRSTVDYILKNYSGDLTLIGFSMGANWVANFLAGYEDRQRIRMGISVCCPFDFYKLRSIFQMTSFYKRFINYFMTRNYKRYIKKSTVDRLWFKDTTFLHEVDAKLFEITGMDMSDDFYKQNSCVRILDRIDRPFLFLNSSDDPVIPENIIPFDICRRNENISLVILKGGHLGFFTNGKETTAEIIISRYFDIVTAQSKLSPK